MELSVLVGGKAGQGVAKLSYVIGKVFTNLGFYVFNYRDYGSLIRGGHNFNIVKVSSKPVYSFDKCYDFIIALDEETLTLHLKDLKESGLLLTTKQIHEKYPKSIGVDASKIIQENKLPNYVFNTIFLGAFFKAVGIAWEIIEKTVSRELKGKENLVAARRGYESVDVIREIEETNKGKRYFINGSEAIAIGALAAGIDLYIGYPMTPATPVLHILAKLQEKFGIKVIQLENEIAVVNAALGASYAGAKVMVGTSGGGFALMNEALSLQGMSEVPLVVYLAQRAGPSTGVPTYTEQGDLKFALNAGHGEFPRVLIAPGDPKEAFYKTIEAFYWAYKYRTLSILLSDKHLAESHFTFSNFEEPKLRVERFLLTGDEVGPHYKNYRITENGVSPRSVPGEKTVVRATSYEHDENGITTEDADMIRRMKEKRLRKWKTIEKDSEKFERAVVYGNGKKLLISWGSTKGAIIDALSRLPGWKFLQIVYFSPFPKEEVRREMEEAEEIVAIENNSTGQMVSIIKENTGLDVNRTILKYDGRPFTPLEIVKGVLR